MNYKKPVEVLGELQDGLRELDEQIARLDRIGANGPRGYYFRKVAEYAEALFDRFAPFHAGDRVVLVRAVDFSEKPGWAHAQEWMIPGIIGEVGDVDYEGGSFRALVRFAGLHDDWFGFNEHYLVKVEVTP